MKKLYYLIVLALILGLVLTGCSLLSNIGQAPATDQSGITYLTKGPSSDLVGLWHLDEGTGITAYDSSGNGNDGTLKPTGSEPTWVSGKFGNALNFDGDGDYVQLPASNTILNTDTFTIEAWFKTSVNHPVYGVGAKEGRLVNLHRTTTASTAVSLYVEQNQIGLLYYTGTAHVYVKYTVNYHDDVWHHIAVTHDATTYRLYYDGAEVASQVDAFGDFGTYPAYLGTYNGSERFFNGDIDEVRIWNTALTEDQLGSVIVAMDIKPQSCPNPLNVKSQGVLPVAILGTENLDVTEVDPDTIELAGVSPLRWALEDVATPYESFIDETNCSGCTTAGLDGYLDLVLKFDTQAVVNAIGIDSINDGDCLVLILTGNLLEEFGETPIVGEDVVLILKKGK